MEVVKKKDRFLLISSLILVGIVIIILAVVFLFPRLEAEIQIERSEDAFDNMVLGDTLLLSDPLFESDRLEKSAEVALDFSAGEDISERIADVLEDAKYSKTKKTVIGSFARSVSLRGEKGIFTVYFTDDGIFLTKEQKQYHFTVDRDSEYEYSELLSDIDKILAQSLEK